MWLCCSDALAHAHILQGPLPCALRLAGLPGRPGTRISREIPETTSAPVGFPGPCATGTRHPSTSPARNPNPTKQARGNPRGRRGRARGLRFRGGRGPPAPAPHVCTQPGQPTGPVCIWEFEGQLNWNSRGLPAAPQEYLLATEITRRVPGLRSRPPQMTPRPVPPNLKQKACDRFVYGSPSTFQNYIS